MSHHVGQTGACDWRTPEWVLKGARVAFGGVIHLDPATSSDNPTDAQVIYTQSGLELEWTGHNLFLNPPWSKRMKMPIAPWLDRLVGCHIKKKILVCPASTNSKWFHKYVWKEASEIFFPEGRIAYDPPPGGDCKNAPTFDSVIALYGEGARPLAECMDRDGFCVFGGRKVF